MAELQYKLMTSAVNNFDCGNPAINEYVENSYFATLLQRKCQIKQCIEK